MTEELFEDKELRRLSDAKPKFMITYWCDACGIDSALSDVHEPYCFMCDSGDRVREIKREPLTPELMAARLKLVTDRMMENLKRAHDARPDDLPGLDGADGEETLLELLDRAQSLKEQMHDAGLLKEDMKDDKGSEN